VCAPRKKLIIELDGSQHLEQQEYDIERTDFLKSKGYRVLRFWNNEVMNNMDTVLNVIWDTLNENNNPALHKNPTSVKTPQEQESAADETQYQENSIHSERDRRR
jgi:Protein of unknown function (DUF559)